MFADFSVDRRKYDYDFMDYTVKVLRKCKEYGFKVYIDPHQDVVRPSPLFTLSFITKHFGSGHDSLVALVHPTGRLSPVG